MQLWGKIYHNAKRNHYAIKGSWQGKRLYISQIPTMTGFLACTTEEHAVYLQREISKQISEGVFQPAKYKKERPLHIKKYAIDWLRIQEKRVESGEISYKTYMGYRSHINRHIIPLIGSEYLPYVNHQKLQEFVHEIPLTPAGRKKVYNCLWGMLGDAFKSGFILQMPHGLKFNLPKKKIVWLEDEAFEKVMELVPVRHHPIIRFIRLTGVRPSEARALRKKDIKADRIDIKKTFAPVKGGEELRIVKNKKEDSIPLYEAVKELLESMPPQLSEFVFTNVGVKPYSMHISKQVWNPYCIEALGYKVKFNNVGRHSFGNKLARAGVDMNTISKLLRHTGVQITKDHYAEEDYGVMKSVVDNVQRIG
ncbi:tyrosine-type recombinase/integrase [bacterium]|nr:tyrosine-type recombinase/integrase [bacterium]